MVVLLILTLISAQIIVAQDAQISSTMTMKVLDSVTGTDIHGAAAMLQDESSELRSIEFGLAETGGPGIECRLPAGKLTLYVNAKGYHSARFKLGPAGATRKNYTVYLDPLQRPAKLDATVNSQRMLPTGMLIAGYITDQSTAAALADVRISAEGLDTPAFSDADGFFELHLPETATISLQFDKPGYVAERRINLAFWDGGDWQFRIEMTQGNGVNLRDYDRAGRDVAEKVDRLDTAPAPESPASSGEKKSDPENLRASSPPFVPLSIRVGRNCSSSTNCSYVEVYSLQTYSKRVLPHEWFSCWGDLPNGMNSLMAGAVAIRSYATWHVENPLNDDYDICDNTFCQFLGETQTSNGNVAVDLTDRYVLTSQGTTTVARSEYSAENNDVACGDQYTGTNSALNPCIYDPVCSGEASFGHGRGMCQWGSIRWANGTHVEVFSPCTIGWNHGFGSKDWLGILDHYYPFYNAVQGSSAEIDVAYTDPSLVSPGQTFDIVFEVEAAPQLELMLGASVAPSGSGQWIDDSANDLLVTLSNGDNTVTRDFFLPAGSPFGTYDLLVALWFDINGNGQINSGDEIVDWQLYPGNFTVGVTGIDPDDADIPQNSQLDQNYPNPFNPTTVIGYSLSVNSSATIDIYNLAGAKIRQLVGRSGVPAANQPAGHYSVTWDGTTDAGQQVSSGIYFYRLSIEYHESAAANQRINPATNSVFVQTRKMMLLR